MYEDVLVPTDGSESAEAAVEHAVGLADRNDAALHALYAIEIGHFSDSLDSDTYEQTVNRLETAGGKAVDRIATRGAEDGVETESAVRTGSPADVILEYVREQDIDVVVMATRGRTGEARQVLGSVTERVIRASEVPVLTVNVDE